MYVFDRVLFLILKLFETSRMKLLQLRIKINFISSSDKKYLGYMQN